MRELAARMPWCYALDETERQGFLGSAQEDGRCRTRAQAGTMQETGSPGAGATVRSE